MKKQQIAKAALDCFTESGYEGASLAQIAEAVGLKKQSLYTHFADKDAIFLAALAYSKAEEMAFYEQFFSEATAPLAEVLQQFLLQLAALFRTSRPQQFWLRVNFYPPPHLATVVEQEVAAIYEASEHHFLALFTRHQEQLTVTPQMATDAFIGVINASLAELLYNTKASKWQASFAVFWRGITT